MDDEDHPRSQGSRGERSRSSPRVQARDFLIQPIPVRRGLQRNKEFRADSCHQCVTCRGLGLFWGMLMTPSNFLLVLWAEKLITGP